MRDHVLDEFQRPRPTVRHVHDSRKGNAGNGGIIAELKHAWPSGAKGMNDHIVFRGSEGD
jgi:hypothetical protein